MFLLFLFFWLFLLLFFVVKRKKTVTKPWFWMAMGWMLIFGLYLTSGINYNNKPSLFTLLYFFTFLLLFAFGCRLGSRRLRKKKKLLNSGYRLAKESPFYDTIFLLLFIAETVSFFVFVVDFGFYNSFTSASHTESRLDKIGVIAEIVCLSGILYWLRSLFVSISKGHRIDIKGFFALFYYLLPGLVISGRQSILLVIVSTIVCFCFAASIRKPIKRTKSQIKRRNRKIIILGIIGGVLFAGYCALVAGNREASVNKIELFEYMFSCTYSNSTKSILSNCGSFETFILETISYYSHEISQLQLVFSNWDGSYYFGASQFQLISSNLPESSFFYVGNIQTKLDSISLNNSSYSHVWRTMVSNCFIDFGFAGGLIFIFVLGYLSGKVFEYAIVNKSSLGVILLSLICSGSFFAIQYSPFVENYWYFPIIFLFLIAIANRFISKKTKSVSQKMRRGLT